MTLKTSAAGIDAASGRKRLLVPVRIGRAVHDDRDEECVAHEIWLVTQDAGAFQIEQLLLAHCTRETRWPAETTMHGDVAFLNIGGLTVPSNWYGTEVVSFDLSWPRYSGLSADYAFRGAACPQERTTSFDEGFTGEVTWQKTAVSATTDDQADACTKERKYVPIPIVALPAEFENGGFRTLPFEECSTTITGTGGGGRGVTVAGATAGPADATLRVVLSMQAFLYLDIADDHPTGASADPSADDHLEVWTSPDADTYMSSIGELPKPERFRIRVADARVFGVEGAAPTSVERAERQGHAVLRIRLPAAAAKPHETGISIVYFDADPGQPRAILATSYAEAITASSLGVAREVHAGVTCRIDGGALVRTLPAKGREQPLSED